MKLITKNTDYAVRALCYVAGVSNYVATKKIGQETKIPLSYLRRILDQLIKNGIIESKEGISGGVKLIKKPSSIRLSDIVKIFQGNIQLTECLFRKKICPNKKFCPLRKKLRRIEKSIEKEFQKITILSLSKKGRKDERKNVLQAM